MIYMKTYLFLLICSSFNCFADDLMYPQKYNPILPETIKESIKIAESTPSKADTVNNYYDRKDFRSIRLDATKVDIKIPLIWYMESF